jgi:hypothetical protein
MMSARTVLCTTGVLVVCAGWLAGCSKAPSTAIGNKQFVGTWVGMQVAVGLGGEAPKFRHELTLNGDGTFKLEVVGTDGKPLAPAQNCEGKWKLKDGRELRFETTTNNLTGDHKDETPYATISMKTKGAGVEADTLEVRFDNGTKFIFQRKS